MLLRVSIVTAEIQPICLPTDQSFRSRDFTRSMPFVAGWGSTSYSKLIRLMIAQEEILMKFDRWTFQ